MPGVSRLKSIRRRDLDRNAGRKIDMIRKIRSILVVGSDQACIQPLAVGLKSRGHRVLIARDQDHALAILEFRALDAMIADWDVLETDGERLISCAACIVPRPRVVVIGDSDSAEKECSLLESGVGLYLSKPVDLGELLDYLEPSPAKSIFSGFIDGVDLLEYLQFLILSGRKTILEVTSSIGTQGRIFLANGLILHAVCGMLQGEQALYSCICFREGTFSHLPWGDPGEVTINKPGEFLLMEAVRKRDEAWSGDTEEEESD